MKVSTFATCILCAAAICGCSRDETLPANVTSALEQAITRHDIAASVAVFADDAQILPQHGPAIRGRQEIEACGAARTWKKASTCTSGAGSAATGNCTE